MLGYSCYRLLNKGMYFSKIMKMLVYVLKRILLMVMVFFVVMTMIFVLIRLLPNDIPETMGDQAYALRALHEAMGYNKPILTQYIIYLKGIIFDGFWGYTTKVVFMTPVQDYVLSKLPATIIVNLYSMLLSLPIGIGLGILAALRKNKIEDQIISVFVIIFVSVPSYVYAFVIQYLFAFKLKVLPATVAALENGVTYFSPVMLKSMILPVLALSFGVIAGFTRFTRAELSETLTSEYMLLARAKGLTKSQATMRHALRNAMVPILPMILSSFISILAGSIIIEKIFSIPGMGAVYVGSVLSRDYDLFLFVSMFYTGISLLGGLLVDLSYGFIDPRIRIGGGKTNEL